MSVYFIFFDKYEKIIDIKLFKMLTNSHSEKRNVDTYLSI